MSRGFKEDPGKRGEIDLRPVDSWIYSKVVIVCFLPAGFFLFIISTLWEGALPWYRLGGGIFVSSCALLGVFFEWNHRPASIKLVRTGNRLVIHRGNRTVLDEEFGQITCAEISLSATFFSHTFFKLRLRFSDGRSKVIARHVNDDRLLEVKEWLEAQ